MAGGKCLCVLSASHTDFEAQPWQMQQRFDMLSNFQDLPSSILPLMQIMTGSGWYEYARTGTSSIGLFGFVFFCLYYFVVFFQFQRIFIAIIVQNFELGEDEKL